MRILLFLNLIWITTLHAADWPQFRGPSGMGISTEKGLPTTWSEKENVIWKVDLPGAGTSSPVFLGDKIFITCYSGFNVPSKPVGAQKDLRLHLVCLDRKTGKQAWIKEIEPKLPEQDNIRDGHGYASSTPAVDSERVYCFFGKTGVIAFDHKGTQLWQADVGSKLNGWGSAASPVLHGDLLYVNASVESETLFALDRKTGKEVWKAKGIRESWNTPVIATTKGKDELLIAVSGKVLAFEPKTGDQLWSCATDIGWYMVPSIVVNDGVAYCIGGRSGTAGLAVKLGGTGDVTKANRLWTSRKGSNVSSPVFHDGHVYFMNDNTGTAFCVKASTGDVVYEERIERAGQVYASSLLADGKIHYLSRDGRTFVLPAKPEYKLLATNKLGDRETWNSTPVAIDGRLFIRSDKALYCIGK